MSRFALSMAVRARNRECGRASVARARLLPCSDRRANNSASRPFFRPSLENSLPENRPEGNGTAPPTGRKGDNCTGHDPLSRGLSRETGRRRRRPRNGKKSRERRPFADVREESASIRVILFLFLCVDLSSLIIYIYVCVYVFEVCVYSLGKRRRGGERVTG